MAEPGADLPESLPAHASVTSCVEVLLSEGGLNRPWQQAVVPGDLRPYRAPPASLELLPETKVVSTLAGQTTPLPRAGLDAGPRHGPTPAPSNLCCPPANRAPPPGQSPLIMPRSPQSWGNSSSLGPEHPTHSLSTPLSPPEEEEAERFRDLPGSHWHRESW